MFTERYPTCRRFFHTTRPDDKHRFQLLMYPCTHATLPIKGPFCICGTSRNLLLLLQNVCRAVFAGAAVKTIKTPVICPANCVSSTYHVRLSCRSGVLPTKLDSPTVSASPPLRAQLPRPSLRRREQIAPHPHVPDRALLSSLGFSFSVLFDG